MLDEELLEMLANKIQAEWRMGGLFSGIYREFIIELLKRYLEYQGLRNE